MDLEPDIKQNIRQLIFALCGSDLICIRAEIGVCLISSFDDGIHHLGTHDPQFGLIGKSEAGGNTQLLKVVFDQIVEWVKLKSGNDNRIASEIVVSFFVQNCEVFDAITE